MEFVNTFWALVPAIVAIVLALITKEVYSSLFIGILVGALLLTGFDPIGTVDAIISGTFVPTGGTEEDAITTGLIPALADSAGIFVFLVMLGILVALINKAGGSGRVRHAGQPSHVKTRVGAQLATFALGVLIFVDDYFNCLTVGAVMRPVTDAAPDLPRQARLPHRRHRRPRVHDRARLLVGRRGLGRRRRPQHRRERHPAVRAGHPL